MHLLQVEAGAAIWQSRRGLQRLHQLDIPGAGRHLQRRQLVLGLLGVDLGPELDQPEGDLYPLALRAVVRLAVGETVILLASPLHPYCYA